MSNFKAESREAIKKDSKLGLIVGERFKLGQMIGSGSFGEIRHALDLTSKQLVAVKLEVYKADEKHPQLELEFSFYKMVGSDADGFPEVYYYGRFGNYNAMAMELLDKNLDDVFDECQKQFSLKTIIYIFLQLLQRIEHVHNSRLVYRDIKPENFVLGRIGMPKKKGNIIHIIDFGLAKPYMDTNGKHIPMKEGKILTGTARYMSINSHIGKELSRRDDLEAIGYMMMYFLRQGNLPWIGLKAETVKESREKIGQYKRGTPIETLCYGFPEPFAEYLRKVRMLEFEETPNYKKLKSLFINLFHKEKFEDNGLYDWNSK